MSYDGVVTCAMTQELKKELVQGKIEKIYQPEPDQLLLSVHTAAGRRKLFISASGNHSGVYLTENSPENPVQPPLFCMVLRKHLGAARIKDIHQRGCERMIEIDLETVDELGFNVNKRLICEIMGKHSNVLLVDIGTGKIIESIKHVGIDVNRARQILPGKLYEYPPEQQKQPFAEVTEEDMNRLMKGQLQPERNILAGVQGVSPALAQTIASAGQTESESPSLSAAAASYRFLDSMRRSIEENTYRSRVYVKDGVPADFHIVPLAAYESDDSYEPLCFDTLSKAAEYFFVNRESSNTVKQRSGDLNRHIKAHLDKLRLKVQRLNEDLAKAAGSDKYRLYGELLNANLHTVKQGDKKAVVTSYYDGSQVEIPLDPRYSPARNAQNYFKKYAKGRTALKEKRIQLDETMAEIDYLESVSSFAERASSVEEIDLLRAELTEGGYLRQRKSRSKGSKTHKAKPKPHEYVLPSGKKVLVGRNNKENDYLTFKKASSTDIWLHTKDIPGSHVILVTEGEAPSEDDLRRAAQIAAHHSKGAGSANVPVDYTKVRYVKKPSGSKPGYVIFTHNRTLYVDPAIPE
ncbi:MAG: Rqc2 family fibronectin-binding protein [Bacillota bacterium]